MQMARQGAVLQVGFGNAQDGVHGGADFVAYGGQKAILGAYVFFRQLGLAFFVGNGSLLAQVAHVSSHPIFVAVFDAHQRDLGGDQLAV
jgi:hypothetical protein